MSLTSGSFSLIAAWSARRAIALRQRSSSIRRFHHWPNDSSVIGHCTGVGRVGKGLGILVSPHKYGSACRWNVISTRCRRSEGGALIVIKTRNAIRRVSRASPLRSDRRASHATTRQRHRRYRVHRAPHSEKAPTQGPSATAARLPTAGVRCGVVGEPAAAIGRAHV